MKSFLIVFMSIIFEAMPFVLIGAFVSSIIHVFVSERFIENILPKQRWMGYIVAALLGIVFPVCECAIVPITRRLVKKGVPIGMAVTFMLAVPIINPVVLLSTYYAFNDKLYMVYARAGFGFLAAVTIGLLTAISQEGGKALLRPEAEIEEELCACGCQTIKNGEEKGLYLSSLLEHTSREFLNILKYLILGAFLSAVFQLAVKGEMLTFISRNSFISVLFMIVLAFILSICSEVDAFIARTFVLSFSSGSILAFLIFGPMLDLKNTLMLLGHFKVKFVVKLMAYITLISIFIGLIANLMF